MKKHTSPRLTLKTAKAVAIKAFGTARGLEKDMMSYNGQWYRMPFGEFVAEIRLSSYLETGRIEVSIYGSVSTTYMLFDPVTLEQDFAAEEKLRDTLEKERVEQWVTTRNPEYCKNQIDIIWNEDNS